MCGDELGLAALLGEAVGGFYDGASSRVLDMLLFRDVSEPPAEDEAEARVSVPG